ncbi:MAG: hypothetical protein ACYC7J_09865 [Syntrophales bacterium]
MGNLTKFQDVGKLFDGLFVGNPVFLRPRNCALGRVVFTTTVALFIFLCCPVESLSLATREAVADRPEILTGRGPETSESGAKQIGTLSESGLSLPTDSKKVANGRTENGSDNRSDNDKSNSLSGNEIFHLLLLGFLSGIFGSLIGGGGYPEYRLHKKST